MQTREEKLAQKKQYNSRPEIKERDKLQKKAWYDANREYVLEKRKTYYSSLENRRKLMLMKSRERAVETGLEFSITIDDIVIPERCPYLDIPLTHELRRGQLETNSSVDRIDSTKGYIPGNVQVVSRLANTMKNNASREQLLTFANNVLSIHK